MIAPATDHQIQTRMLSVALPFAGQVRAGSEERQQS
jgi:hypothetical protein